MTTKLDIISLFIKFMLHLIPKITWVERLPITLLLTLQKSKFKYPGSFRRIGQMLYC